jgi:4-amino-4-deoxy-L-arabinose transferase-like glycosyltransferase
MEATDELNGPRMRACLKPIEKLIDALADPVRRERTMLAVLAAYAVVWTLYGVIAKSSQDLHVDSAELAAWSHHMVLGYAKHPPLAGWIVHGWFTLFPITDWSYYLLAMVYAATGLWIAWQLFSRFLDADKRIAALACLTLVPFFNFHGLRFDHNAVLPALWVATAYCYIRSFETRSPAWAALAGIAAAAAVLGKYWSIFLLVGLGVAALLDARRATYFRSAAPWITVFAGLLALAPHLVWLWQNDLISLLYAFEAHGTKVTGSIGLAALRYLAGAAGYAAAPVLLVLALTRPSGAALADVLVPRTPERRFVVVAFWATMLLPAVISLLSDYGLNPIWSMTDFVLLPVVLLSSPLLVISRRALIAIVGLAVALPLVALALSPVIAVAIHLRGVDPVPAHAKLLAAHVEQEWRRNSDRPLRIVGGDFGLANATAFYLPEQPSVYPVLETETAPWVTPARIAREGAVMVCELPDLAHDCVLLIRQAIDRVTAQNPQPR